ncbi:gamma-interferon-inducible lysosomal thiol reductase-like [Ornithodoros turicata]|uniref:gamma-interferon-inducible lysosomal thiol reductase-like n=1 Tax=Ornithodoros turicata TaxID=34597 RepID=UPI0031394D47
MLPVILIGILALLCVQLLVVLFLMTSYGCALVGVCEKKTACVEPGTKVLVEVFYESYCPDSKRFVLEQLNSTYPELSSIIELDLVPYGKASRTLLPNGWSAFECQHGEQECYGNLLQSCAIHFYPDPKRHLPFIACMFNSRSPNSAYLPCRRSAGFEDDVLDQCNRGKQGNDLQVQYAKQTESVNSRKRLEFVPWIRLNKHDRMYEAFTEFKMTVCKEYRKMLQAACDSESSIQQSIPSVCRGLVN